MSAAIEAVLAERARQDAIWPRQDHSFPVWLAVLMEEVGESSHEHLLAHYESRGNDDNMRAELVQVAAVALRMIESFDQGHCR